MEFRRNQEDMVGYNPQIRSSAFSKPLLPPTASLLGTPRNNGTSDVFNPVSLPVPTTNLDSSTAVAASVVIGVGDAFAVTPSFTGARSTLTKDSSAPGEPKAKYRECLRNHAASLGGYVLDGCGDFMPAGESDPLKCAACGCHRSFHRREVEGESSYFNRFGNGSTSHGGRMPLLPPPPPMHHHPPPPPQQWLPRSPGGAAAAAAAATAAAFGGNYSGSGGATTESSSEENPGGAGTEPGQGPPAAAGSSSRKRFRSKFTTEQKKRMLAFADSVGWRMQKQDEALVDRFCAEVGVRRQVLKVWMHNNKHTVRRQQQEHQQHQQIQHQQEHQQRQQIQHQQEHQQHQQILHQQQHHQQEHQQQQHNQQQQLH